MEMEIETSGTSDDSPSVGYGGRCMSTQAMQSLYDLRENNLFCDATVRLEDGGIFPVHRAILSACSTYFRTLFTTPLYTQEKTDVLLPDVDSETMNLIVKYAYLRSLDVNDDNVCKVLIAANYLWILGILDICQDYLKNQLTPENCISIMGFAKEHSCQNLEYNSHTYIMRNFIDVAKNSSEIIELSIEKLLPIIDSDLLNVKSEEVVWELIVRWINNDPDNRKIYIVNLLKTVRLGLLETQYFLENVKDHKYVAGVETCRPIIIETLTFLYDLEMITKKNTILSTPEIARPRVPHEIIFAIGGWKNDLIMDCIETYDTRADRWIPMPHEDPEGGRGYHGSAVIGFNIYVIGGFNTREYLNSCRCFNAVTKTWREIAPMNCRRCYVSVVVLDDMIYAMGGHNRKYRLNTVERYNYKENQWSLLPTMKRQRSDASATTLNNKIYIVGGFNGSDCLSSAEVYDPQTNQWTLIAPMRHRRSGVSCIAYHNCIYALGGFNGEERINSCEKYDPIINRWEYIPQMYNPRSNFATAIIDDMIFAIGGYNGLRAMYFVECYDEKTNEWYEASDMNISRSALSACVVMGLPNIYDYIHNREHLMEVKRQEFLAFELQKKALPMYQQHHQFVQQFHYANDDNNDDNNNNNNNNNQFHETTATGP